jgi:hypothetical protein
MKKEGVPNANIALFNVFHVCALYYTKTLVHVSTLLGHLQGELFIVVALRLHFIVE